MTCYYFDTETYEKEGEELKPVLNTNKYVLGCISNGKWYRFYEKPEELKKEILRIAKTELSLKKRPTFYAHYATYDVYALFKKELKERKLKKLNNCEIYKYKDTNEEIRQYKTTTDTQGNTYEQEIIVPLTFDIIDTMNFSNTSLKEIGIKINLEKGELPTKITNANQLKTYLQRDVEILATFIEKLKKDLTKLGGKPKILYTAPQIAVNKYITWLQNQKESKNILKTISAGKSGFIQQIEHEFIREAYKGGRNEAFQTGTFTNCAHIDMNAMYPYATTQIQHPNLTKQYVVEKPLKIIKLNNLLENYIGVAEITIQCPEDKEIGLLPINVQDEQIYPTTGKIEGTYTLIEIQKALQEGYKLINMKKAVFYAKLPTNPLAEYMKKLYQIRQENNEIKDTIKLLMNSLIGKLASRPEEQEETLVNPEQANIYKKHYKKEYS